MQISVIIPVYNSEQYLHTCVESILNQTFRDFELILVNDGSTDASGSICDEFAKKDSRVIVLHKSNEGVSAARNDGIEVARGEYITFVDSDDAIKPSFFEDACRKIDKADLYISGLEMVTCKDDVPIRSTSFGIQKSKSFCVAALLETVNVEYPLICISSPCCKLYKKNVIDLYKIRFDKTLSLGEDTSFNLDYLSRVESVYFDECSYYTYFIRGKDSLFNKYHPDIYEICVKVYSKLISSAHKKGCSEEGMKHIKKLYVSNMISAITHIYRYAKKNKEKFSVVKKVENDQIVRNFENSFHGRDRVTLQVIKLRLPPVSHLLFLYITYRENRSAGKV